MYGYQVEWQERRDPECQVDSQTHCRCWISWVSLGTGLSWQSWEKGGMYCKKLEWQERRESECQMGSQTDLQMLDYLVSLETCLS